MNKKDEARLEPLRAVLGEADLAGLEPLTKVEAARLATAITGARSRQAHALGVAIDDSLSHLPFLVRKAVARALGR